MNNLQIFENPEFGRVRTVDINGDSWFVGKDVAQALGYTNPRKALTDHVDKEDKTDGVTIRDSIGREQNPICINESGLYALIFGSKLESAKRFKRWVTAEVLPAIRKTGSYTSPDQDTRKWLATLVLQASGEKLEYLRRLYPEYLGERPISSGKREDSYNAWISNIPDSAENYICSIPTTELYDNFHAFCDGGEFILIGKKLFYRAIEDEFDLVRRQRHDGRRYFCKKEGR